MPTRLYNILNKISNGLTLSVLLLLSTALMLLVNLFDLPFSVPRIVQLSNGAGILDTRLFYTSQKAYEILQAQGSAGRYAYMNFLTLFDSFFPILYSLTFAVVILVLFRRTYLVDLWGRMLLLTPFIVCIFDYMENITILTMLFKYPVHIEMAALAGYFTLAKWIFTWISVFLIGWGIVRAMVNFLSARKKLN